jgi:hypothetical protein
LFLSSAEPATVVTTPAVVTFRIVSLPASVTMRLPSASTVMPVGVLNWAFVPVPSAWPMLPAEPANVVTTPADVTLRIVLFPVSAT